MRTEAWKRLFTEQGWLDGDRLIPPANSNVEVHFRDGRIAFLSSISQATDDHLVIALRNQTIYVLWDDIKDVIVEKN